VSWTTPEEIAAQVLRQWERGRLLAAMLRGDGIYPLAVRITRPNAHALSEEFQAARDWISALEGASKAQLGHGYEIEWAEINHRVLGRNRIPRAVVIPTEEDALGLIGKRRDAERFRAVVEATRKSQPLLCDWLAKHPLVALEHANDWDRVLAVVAWLKEHPRCGLYLRQLDVASVDSKFIESRKGLLSELLDLALPPDAIDRQAAGARRFEARYGLRPKPALVRFRMLDPRLFIHGLYDISTPVSQFARLAPPVDRVFITENETNGLAFPDVPGSLVIFGLGYGIDSLREVDWLRTKHIHYWGDIDTHGFAMLGRVRDAFPQTQSFLMDRETLLAHRALWGREDEPSRDAITHLTTSEQQLLDEIRTGAFAECVRLEQERVSFGFVRAALEWAFRSS